MLRILAYWCSWPDDRSKRPAEPFPCCRCDELISENVRDYWREGETESVIEMFPACKNSCGIWTKKVEEAFHWFLSCVLSFSCVTFNKFKESYKHFTFLESGPTERSLKLYLSAYFIQGSFMKWRQKRPLKKVIEQPDSEDLNTAFSKLLCYTWTTYRGNILNVLSTCFNVNVFLQVSTLMSKFDEMRVSGNMMPSASLTNESANGMYSTFILYTRTVLYVHTV